MKIHMGVYNRLYNKYAELVFINLLSKKDRDWQLEKVI